MPDILKADIMKALVLCKGMVAAAARNLGCSRSTIYNWAARDEDVREVLATQRHEFVDMAELALIKLVGKGKWESVRFVLERLGKDRGYAPPAQEIRIDVSKLSDEELEKIK